MKNHGIIRRTPENSLHTFLVKLDADCVPEGDSRQIFAVIDRQFQTLGTARIKERRHGQYVFEMVIPNKATAAALYSLTDKENQSAGNIWGHSNRRCQDIFCIELGIMSQANNPESFGYREYNPIYRNLH